MDIDVTSHIYIQPAGRRILRCFVLFSYHAYIHTHIPMWVGIVPLFTFFVLTTTRRYVWTTYTYIRLISELYTATHTNTKQTYSHIRYFLLIFPSLFSYEKIICFALSLLWIFFCQRCWYSFCYQLCNDTQGFVSINNSRELNCQLILHAFMQITKIQTWNCFNIPVFILKASSKIFVLTTGRLFSSQIIRWHFSQLQFWKKYDKMLYKIKNNDTFSDVITISPPPPLVLAHRLVPVSFQCINLYWA